MVEASSASSTPAFCWWMCLCGYYFVEVMWADPIQLEKMRAESRDSGAGNGVNNQRRKWADETDPIGALSVPEQKWRVLDRSESINSVRGVNILIKKEKKFRNWEITRSRPEYNASVIFRVLGHRATPSVPLPRRAIAAPSRYPALPRLAPPCPALPLPNRADAGPGRYRAEPLPRRAVTAPSRADARPGGGHRRGRADDLRPSPLSPLSLSLSLFLFPHMASIELLITFPHYFPEKINLYLKKKKNVLSFSLLLL